MSISNQSKDALVTVCNAIINGLTALSGADSIVSAGVTLTKAQLLAPLQSYVALVATSSAARTKFTTAVAAEGAGKEAALEMIEDNIKPYLQQRLGKSSKELATYGLEPAKAPQKSAATKAAAVQKSQATRKALGTKGAAQKKAAKKALEAQPATPAATTASSTTAKSGS